MSGKHGSYTGKHRARTTRVRNTAGLAAAVGTASMLVVASAHADVGAGWDAIADCESSGNWSIHSGSYEGGLQFSPSTWLANGGAQYAAHAYQASKEQQIAVARRVLATQGIGAWPVCGRGTTIASLAGPTVAAEPKHAAPAPTRPQPSTNAAPVLPAYTGSTTDYVVAEGDTLEHIATAQQVPGGWPQIVAANQDTLPDPDQLQVGQQLKLPSPVEPTMVPLGLPQPVKFSSPPQLELKAFVAPAAPAKPATVTAQGTSGGIAARAVTAALSFRGVPYVYGGNGRAGIDCSALVVAAYRAAGISMPRTAAAQAAMGRTVKLADVRAGDLLFYAYGDGISHVALAVDSGHIVEASQPGKPVATRAIYTSNLSVIKRLT